MAPKICYGNRHKVTHCKGCRKGRPRCLWRRPRPCHCGAYHFPHREGSGACGDEAAYIARLKQPRNRMTGS